MAGDQQGADSGDHISLGSCMSLAVIMIPVISREHITEMTMTIAHLKRILDIGPLELPSGITTH